MKRLLILLIILLISLSSTFGYCFSINHSNAFDSYIESGVKGELTKAINNILIKELNQRSNDKYTNIVRNDDKSIDYISVNTAAINSFSNDISEIIHSCIRETNNEFAIPLGDTLGIKLLSNKGPKLNINVSHLNSVMYEINSELISSGINQTLHRITVDFFTTVKCTGPFHETELVIKNSIIISEILLVGKVPEVLVSPIGS